MIGTTQCPASGPEGLRQKHLEASLYENGQNIASSALGEHKNRSQGESSFKTDARTTTMLTLGNFDPERVFWAWREGRVVEENIGKLPWLSTG